MQRSLTQGVRLCPLRWPEQREVLWNFWSESQKANFAPAFQESKKGWSRNVARLFRAEPQGQFMLYRFSRPIGALALKTVHFTKGGYGRLGHVVDLYVSPACRRRGYARGMLKFAEIYFRSQGAMKATLAVTRNNTAAVRLYENLGYRVVKSTKNRGVVRWMMEKVIT